MASITNVAANVTMVIVTANNPAFVVQGWHTVLVMYAYAIALGLINMYAFWLIPWIQLMAGILHIMLWLTCVIVFLTLAPKHSTDFVFESKAEMSGWTDEFVSFNLGAVLITWAFVGFDAAAHLSEVRGYMVAEITMWLDPDH